jgi:hypothetical protein
VYHFQINNAPTHSRHPLCHGGYNVGLWGHSVVITLAQLGRCRDSDYVLCFSALHKINENSWNEAFSGRPLRVSQQCCSNPSFHISAELMGFGENLMVEKQKLSFSIYNDENFQKYANTKLWSELL